MGGRAVQCADGQCPRPSRPAMEAFREVVVVGEVLFVAVVVIVIVIVGVIVVIVFVIVVVVVVVVVVVRCRRSSSGSSSSCRGGRTVDSPNLCRRLHSVHRDGLKMGTANPVAVAHQHALLHRKRPGARNAQRCVSVESW